MPTTGFTDNFRPDAWMRDLARRVQWLVSEPEQMRHFRDQLDEWSMRDLIRFSEGKDWGRRRKQHVTDGQISARLRDREVGPPPGHPDWSWEYCPEINDGVWMPPEYARGNKPDTDLALPFKDHAPTLWESYAILAALHDRVLSGLDHIVPRHNPQSDMSGEMLSQQKAANISHLQLVKQIPNLTQKDRPALEKCLIGVCAGLNVPTPAAERIETPAVQVTQSVKQTIVHITENYNTTIINPAPGVAGVADYEGFVPADTLCLDHGIHRTRLAEAATAGTVETKRAPKGLRDTEGREIRKLYHKKQAIRHCSVKRKAHN